MNKLEYSAYLALFFGIGLAAFETLVNWGQWQWWPFWLIDYAAAILLICGAFSVFRQHGFAAKLLCAGWAFTLAMFWMSLAGNIENGTDPARAARAADLYVLMIVFSIVLALIGLILALMEGANKAR